MGEGGHEVLLTIRDASRATGLSVKAIRRRVERGTLPATLVDGIRRVPMSELMRAGLLVRRPEDRRHEAPGSPPAVEALTRRVAELEARVAELEARDGGRLSAEPERQDSHLASLDTAAPL